MPFSNSMDSKCKTNGIIEDSNYDSDNSNIVMFKTRRINAVDDSDTNININNTENTSKCIRIMENEYNDQSNSIKFVEKSGPRHYLPDSAKQIEYFNLVVLILFG
jgi:hypothetical protein